MKSGRYAARIEFSRQEGLQRLVDGTPTFYINGRKFGGPRATSDAFKAIVDSLAAAAPRRTR
jgi:protein-disulfide isomerase